MNLARLDGSEDSPRIAVTKGSSFVGCDHQNFLATPFAPGDEALLVAVNRYSLARFEGDDCCFFLASYLRVRKAFSSAD